jgi:NDP-sugar pyrophosphorylase family protein
MVNHVQNFVSVNKLQPKSNEKIQNAISFKANQSPLTSVRFTGSNPISLPTSDRMGEIRFSESPKEVVRDKDSIGKDEKIAKIKTSANKIELFKDTSPLAKPHATVSLKQGTPKGDIQVAYQDNKGGFALKLWDKQTKTAYVLFDNTDDNAIVDTAKFKATVGAKPINALAFLGSKAVESKPDADLDRAIENALVVGMFGGFGTRLMAVSDPNTKPTTGLGDNSFEVNMLKTVANSGFKNIGASLYFKPDQAMADIEGAKSAGKLPEDLKIAYAAQNDQTGNLGTAGAVRHTAEHILTAKVADQLAGKNSDEANQILNKELGETLAAKVMNEFKKEGSYNQQLKQIAIDNPALRAEIFEKKIDDVPFIAIVSGDHVTDIDMKEFAKTHLDSNATFTLALRQMDDAEMADFKDNNKSPYGHAAINEDNGTIKTFLEKPSTEQYEAEINKGNDFSWLNTGVYIVSPKVLKEYIPSEAEIKAYKESKGEGAKAEGCDFGKDVIPGLVNSGIKLNAHKVKQHWADVGNNVALQDELVKIIADINNKNGKTTLLPGMEFDSTDNSAISTSANVNNINKGKDLKLFVASNASVNGAKVDGTVYVGPDAAVEPGSYKNVWITKQEQPLYKSLNATA